jgi:hypothetical protein
MAFSVLHSGTQSSVTLNTAYILGNSGAAYTSLNEYQLQVDCGAMTNGNSTDAADETQITVYYITLSSGTERVFFRAFYKGLQADPHKITIPCPSDISIKFELKQTAGVGRSYPWKVFGLV